MVLASKCLYKCVHTNGKDRGKKENDAHIRKFFFDEHVDYHFADCRLYKTVQ